MIGNTDKFQGTFSGNASHQSSTAWTKLTSKRETFILALNSDQYFSYVFHSLDIISNHKLASDAMFY